MRSEPDERRYLFNGSVAHLLVYGQTAMYQAARCGISPQWGRAWLGSGTQREYDTAANLALCKRCERKGLLDSAEK